VCQQPVKQGDEVLQFIARGTLRHSNLQASRIDDRGSGLDDIGHRLRHSSGHERAAHEPKQENGWNNHDKHLPEFSE
jgi:hypothetical protein